MCYITGITLGMGLANETLSYHVTSSLIDWAHTQNDPDIVCKLEVVEYPVSYLDFIEDNFLSHDS